MAEKNHLIVRVTTSSGSSPYVTLTEVAYHCGIHPELVGRFVDLGLLDVVDHDVSGEAIFQTEVILLVKKILRLRNQLGVNYAGIGVILELMSRIEDLEAHIRDLEKRVFGDD